MSANRDAKVELVNSIKDKIQNAKSVVVINYGGITVAQDTELRNKFRAENVEYRVYKNRLVLRALQELGYEVKEELLQGTNSVAISYDDETAGPRIVNDFIKANKDLKESNILGAIILKWVKEDKITFINEVKGIFNKETSSIDMSKDPDFANTIEILKKKINPQN